MQFSAAGYSVNENEASVTVSVTRTNGSDNAISVEFDSNDGSATAGSDYTAVSGTLNFSAGETSKNFTVSILDDTLFEGNGTVNLTLGNPTGGATLGAPSTAVLTITDDDPTPVVSIDPSFITEGNIGTTDAVFSVRLSGAASQAVVVNFQTENGTASAGSDYVALTSSVTIPAGQTSGTIRVLVTGDQTDEPDETFAVHITSASNATVPANTVAVGTIRDDDLALGRISGMKFDDGNGNGVNDVGEPGIAGWVIFLDNNNNGIRDGGVETNTRNATTVPQPIPGGGTVNSTLGVAGLVGPIRDVNVRLDITHSFVGDLTITLVSPSGTRVQLVAEDSLPPLELDEDDFTNTTFDDEATTAITGGEAPFTGSFRPMNPLAAFDGQFAAGTWTLEVSDTAERDEGSLDSWSLTIQTDETDRPATTDAAGNYALDNLADGSYRVREVQQTDWFQTTPNPNPIAITGGSSATGINFGNRRDAQGPTIDRVDLVRDARGKKVLQLVITFNERLAPAGAGNVANYLLEKVGRRNCKPVQISSAFYNDAARSVTLNLRHTISAKSLANYELTVLDSGTLTDLFSNRLDGDRNGVPGGDFVRSLSQGAILSVVDELLESGELTGRRGFSESLESSLARFVGLSRPTR